MPSQVDSQLDFHGLLDRQNSGGFFSKKLRFLCVAISKTSIQQFAFMISGPFT
jgi:hypothetical protein